MTKGIVEHDFREVTEENAGTTGEKLYVKYGITGIRGQAEKGVPAVMEAGLPALERGLKKGLSLEQAGCAALLALMVSTVDTNLIDKSDWAKQSGNSASGDRRNKRNSGKKSLSGGRYAGDS